MKNAACLPRFAFNLVCIVHYNSVTEAIEYHCEDTRGRIHKEWIADADSTTNCTSLAVLSALSRGPVHKRDCANDTIARTRP